jgi:signal transduction histidine kinase
MRRPLMARIPIRLRVTLAFVAVMSVVLATIGLFLYLRFGSEFDRTINQGLRSRTADVAALVQQADSGLAQSGRSPLTEHGEGFAQILDPGGAVIDATPQLGKHSLLNRAELAAGSRRTLIVDRAHLPGLRQASRLLVTPVHGAQGQRLVAVVGTSLEQRHSALGDLGSLLLVGGPVALLLASLAGYGLAAGALRPVELMRRRAAEISTAAAHHRLPVPPVDDEVGRLGHTLNEMLARLESAFERLEAALARERTFVSDASHELRTPLTVLRAELELAMRSGRSATELREAVRSAAEETDRLSQLAEDLLVIARSDGGRLPVRLAEVHAEELFDNTRERFARRAADQGRALVVEPTDGTRLVADRLRLQQALGNMVDNALRYGEGDVTLSATARNGSVELHVRDGGKGFPPAFIDDAFERFSRADTGRGRGGTGLGLAIVAAIAESHRGHAHATNAPAGGADVWLELPAAGA